MSFKRVAFHTLGCKVNQYETENIRKQFLDNGFEEVLFNETAEVYIVNSCTVTSIADRKTRNLLRRAKKLNRDAKVVITGCYAQTNETDLKNIEEIDFIIGNEKKNKIYDIVVKEISYELTNIFEDKEYLELESSVYREMSRAYIKIQDGCNNFCSFCKIPFARGRNRSRKFENIIEEAYELAKDGFKEIILIGINIGAYGEDIENKYILEDIIDKISEIEGIKRIRLGSLYPDRITDRLVDIFKKNTKMMPHLHVSIQSGDDTVLKNMNRHYDSKLIYNKLSMLKESVDNLLLTGDIIVGFPGESDIMFDNSYALIKKIGFSDLHIFQYSDRENTKASKMSQKISSQTKKERADRLEELRLEMYDIIRKNQIGKKLEILVENIKKGVVTGYSSNYLKISIENKDMKLNQLYKVDITGVSKELLKGVWKTEE